MSLASENPPPPKLRKQALLLTRQLREEGWAPSLFSAMATLSLNGASFTLVCDMKSNGATMLPCLVKNVVASMFPWADEEFRGALASTVLFSEVLVDTYGHQQFPNLDWGDEHGPPTVAMRIQADFGTLSLFGDPKLAWQAIYNGQGELIRRLARSILGPASSNSTCYDAIACALAGHNTDYAEHPGVCRIPWLGRTAVSFTQPCPPRIAMSKPCHPFGMRELYRGLYLAHAAPAAPRLSQVSAPQSRIPRPALPAAPAPSSAANLTATKSASSSLSRISGAAPGPASAVVDVVSKRESTSQSIRRPQAAFTPSMKAKGKMPMSVAGAAGMGRSSENAVNYASTSSPFASTGRASAASSSRSIASPSTTVRSASSGAQRPRQSAAMTSPSAHRPGTSPFTSKLAVSGGSASTSRASALSSARQSTPQTPVAAGAPIAQVARVVWPMAGGVSSTNKHVVKLNKVGEMPASRRRMVEKDPHLPLFPAQSTPRNGLRPSTDNIAKPLNRSSRASFGPLTTNSMAIKSATTRVFVNPAEGSLKRSLSATPNVDSKRARVSAGAAVLSSPGGRLDEAVANGSALSGEGQDVDNDECSVVFSGSEDIPEGFSLFSPPHD